MWNLPCVDDKLSVVEILRDGRLFIALLCKLETNASNHAASSSLEAAVASIATGFVQAGCCIS